MTILQQLTTGLLFMSMILQFPLVSVADSYNEATPDNTVRARPDAALKGANPFSILGISNYAEAPERSSAALEKAYNGGRVPMLEPGYNFDKSMESAKGRAEFNRMMSSINHILRTNGGPNLAEEARKLSVRQGLFDTKNGMSSVERDVARYNNLWSVAKDRLPEYRNLILEQRATAWENVKNKGVRAMSEFRMGLKPMRMASLPTPGFIKALGNGYYRTYSGRFNTGTYTDIKIEPRLDTSMSTLMKNLSTGAVRMTGTTMMIFGAMYLFGSVQMLVEYRNNPMAMNEIWSKYGSGLMLMSMMGFGAGSGAWGAWTRAQGLGIQGLHQLHQQGLLAANMRTQDKMARKLINMNMQGISMGAMVSGLIVSQLVYHVGDYLSACWRIAADGPMSPAQRRHSEQLCDKGFLPFMGEVLPQMLPIIPLLLGAQALNLWAGTSIKNIVNGKGVYTSEATAARAESARAAQTAKTRNARSMIRSLGGRVFRQGAPRALLKEVTTKPAIMFIARLGMGFMSIAGFMIIIHVAIHVGTWMWQRLSKGYNIKKWRNRFKERAKAFVDNGFNYEECIPNYWQLQESDDAEEYERSWRGFFADWTPFGIVDEEIKCLKEQRRRGVGFTNFMDEYSRAKDDHRNFVLEQLNSVVAKWQEYYMNAYNMYYASKLFYSDIIGQQQL